MSASSRLSKAENPVPIRVVLVDADQKRCSNMREAIEIAGFGEPETAQSGDEALDVLGQQAQQFGVVAAWMPLADDSSIDFTGVLRRCKSPVRLLVVTGHEPAEFPSAGRLAGVAGFAGTGGEREVVRMIRLLATTSGTTIAEVVADGCAPITLDDDWANRIYGVPAGARFHGRLD